jgi:hypothetical protein
MKAKVVVAILILSMLIVSGLACGGGDEPETTPTPAPTLTPTPEPTPGRTPTRCEVDRDAIQAALDTYHDDTGEWPTADGQPGNIEWDKLVADFLDEKPSTDSKCDWQVNSNPEGQVCLWERC